jgi:predicted transcriptional regulator
MDFLEEYRTGNVTIEDLSQKYNISQKRIREVLRAKGIRIKHLKTKKVTLETNAIFKDFLKLYLVEGKAIKHYAEKFNVPLSSLNKKLDKYFKLRKK